MVLRWCYNLILWLFSLYIYGKNSAKQKWQYSGLYITAETEMGRKKNEEIENIC